MSEVADRIRRWEELGEQVPLKLAEFKSTKEEESVDRFPFLGGDPATPYNHEIPPAREEWVANAIERWKVTNPAAREYKALIRQLALDCEQHGLGNTPLLESSVKRPPSVDARRLLIKVELAASSESESRISDLTGKPGGEVCRVAGATTSITDPLQQADHDEPTDPPDPTRLTSLQQEIIDVIKQAGCRLTTAQVLNALAEEQKIASEGTTKNYLAELVRSGHLTNRRDVRPPGYGLSDWETNPPRPGDS